MLLFQKDMTGRVNKLQRGMIYFECLFADICKIYNKITVHILYFFNGGNSNIFSNYVVYKGRDGQKI